MIKDMNLAIRYQLIHLLVFLIHKIAWQKDASLRRFVLSQASLKSLWIAFFHQSCQQLHK